MRGKPTKEKLVMRYLRRQGFSVAKRVVVGNDGKYYEVLVAERDGETRPVLIRDWKRTVGVNVTIEGDVLAEKLGLDPPIIVGPRFSDRAMAFAHRRDIILVRFDELSLM